MLEDGHADAQPNSFLLTALAVPTGLSQQGAHLSYWILGIS